MIKICTVILVIGFLVSCGQGTDIETRAADSGIPSESMQKITDLKKEKEKLLETDRLFAQASEEKGFAKAFDFFLAEEAHVFQNGFPPLVGRDAIVGFLTENVMGTIAWEPYFVEMSASADLGYTLGKFRRITKDASGKESISFGHYVTIWKKQPDASWKVVFDSGIQTPD